MRRWGVVVAVLGVLLLAGAAVLAWVVVPNGQVLPADTDDKIVYAGTLTSLDQAALARGDVENAIDQDVPIRVHRHVQALQTEGDKARVSDSAVVTEVGSGRIVDKSTHFYTIDRQSLMAVPNFTDKPAVRAEGLVIGFPIGTEKYNYLGWVQEAEDTGHAQYQGEGKVQGLPVYRFAGEATFELTGDLAPGATSMPKSELPGMVEAMGLPAETQQLLDSALPLLPDEIPLTYSLTTSDKYTVEPTTGVIVDMVKTTTTSVGMAGVPDMQFPVADVTVRYTPQNVTDMVAKARDGADQVQLYGTTIPLALAGVGLLFLVVSIPMIARRRRGEETPPPAPPREPALTR